MRLTVVGCAGSFPNAESPASCYLVEHDGARIVLDLGNGSLGALQQYVDLDDPGSLDAVVLSHCHIDHMADLASLYVVRRYHPSTRFPRLTVIGPDETRQRLAGVYGLADPAPLDEVLEFRPLSLGPLDLGAFRLEAVRAAHPVEAYCVRVTAADGVSLTYSGDTGPTPRLDALAAGTDLALFESSYHDDDRPPDLHLSGGDAGRAAAVADAGLLVLTHLSAWTDADRALAGAQAAFDGPIEVARPGLTITVEATA
jgi:ribonuclease BN (tRNA processing enzyme)